MNVEITEFIELRKSLLKLHQSLLAYERKHRDDLRGICAEYKRSAINFLHYIALRKMDLRDLQLRLAHRGLSSLGRSEGYVIHNIEEIINRLTDCVSRESSINFHYKKSQLKLDWLDAERLLHRHSQTIFGPKPSHRHIYVMVTAPEASEVTPAWAERILLAGANLVRVNCAHESEEEWLKIVLCLRATAERLRVPLKILMDLGGPKHRVVSPKKVVVRVGDTVSLGGPFSNQEKHIECSDPKILDFVKVGDRVLFDDGKIQSIVTKVREASCRLEITRTPEMKSKIRVEKGINFPDSHLEISEITKDDLKHLKFVAEHADLVGISFVQSPKAIRRIRKELKHLGKADLGIVLKIETRAGFQALPRLLLEAMRHSSVAVMIARGDLAVEVGFERMAEVQEEILCLCEAAHIPVIWATQVLESLAKNGLPSRAEVTDVATAVRAECVMLNKGPFIDQAVRSLDDILRRMERHYYKKRSLYRPLQVAKI